MEWGAASGASACICGGSCQVAVLIGDREDKAITMRFLGPRSISSLLKTALDVIYAGLIGILGADLLGLITLLSVPTLALEVAHSVAPGTGDHAFGELILVLTAFGLSLAGYVVVMRWIREIFATLIAGDVFQPRNVWRLRLIGFGLAGLELFGFGVRLMINHLMGLEIGAGYGLRAVTTWFSVMVVFVLAEVFKEGARLRAETELTV